MIQTKKFNTDKEKETITVIKATVQDVPEVINALMGVDLVDLVQNLVYKDDKKDLD